MPAHLLAFALAALALLAVGLFMSFSPTLYAVVFHELNASRNAARMIRALAIGLGLGVALLLALFRFLDPGTLTRWVLDGIEALLVRRGVDIVAGVVLLALAGVTWRRGHPHPDEPDEASSGDSGNDAGLAPEAAGAIALSGPPAPGPDGLARAGHPWGMFGFGVVSAGLSTNRLVIIYTTSRAVVDLTPHLLAELVLYAVFLTGLVTPYLLADWGWRRFPRASASIHRLYLRLTSWNMRPLGVALLVVAGGFFLAMGLTGRTFL